MSRAARSGSSIRNLRQRVGLPNKRDLEGVLWSVVTMMGGTSGASLVVKLHFLNGDVAHLLQVVKTLATACNCCRSCANSAGLSKSAVILCRLCRLSKSDVNRGLSRSDRYQAKARGGKCPRFSQPGCGFPRLVVVPVKRTDVTLSATTPYQSSSGSGKSSSMQLEFGDPKGALCVL